jgi:hypothetical protein
MDWQRPDRWIAQWMEGSPFRDRRVVAAWLAVQVLSLIVIVPIVSKTLAPTLRDPKPPKLVDGPGDMRFGLPEDTRREIFKEIAAAEPRAREQGVAGFPSQLWSQEDHRCAFERITMREISDRRKLNLQIVYLVMDEGVRNKWPGPDGKPLIATTIPLDPRRH